MKGKVLIVSYYYPPVGGIGLPGCSRVVKFVKYLRDWEISVLTVRTDQYPDFFDLDNQTALPVRDETIYRTSITDLFKKMLAVRSAIRGCVRAGRNGPEGGGSAHGGQAHSGAIPSPPEDDRSRGNAFRKTKDFVHDLCYFPDHASPWIPDAIMAGLKIIRKERPDLLFATGMPWSALVIAHVLSRWTGVPYIVDFRDPWIDNPFHRNKGRCLGKMDGYLERAVVRKSALVTANTAGLRNRMLGRYPELTQDKIVELSNGYDPDDFAPVDRGVDGSGNNRTLTLAHAGFLYGERDPSPILRAIRRTCDRHRYGAEDIQFLQIGKLEDSIREAMEDDVRMGFARCLGQIPHPACIATLRNADVLLIIQQGTETQIPSKIYEYICLNKPILTVTQKEGALWELVERNAFGRVFEPHDVEAIADAIHDYCVRKAKTGALKEDYPRKSAFEVANIADRLCAYMAKIRAGEVS